MGRFFVNDHIFVRGPGGYAEYLFLLHQFHGLYRVLDQVNEDLQQLAFIAGDTGQAWIIGFIHDYFSPLYICLHHPKGLFNNLMDINLVKTGESCHRQVTKEDRIQTVSLFEYQIKAFLSPRISRILFQYLRGAFYAAKRILDLVSN